MPAKPPPPTGVSTSGLFGWVEHNILGLAILFVGCYVLFRAHKRNLPDAVTVVTGVLLGLLVVGLASNGNGLTVGQWLAHTLFG